MALGTIGEWTTTQLVKFVKDVLEKDPPSSLPSITVDEIVVKSRLVVNDQITVTRDPNFRIVGATGEPAFANSWVAYGAPYHSPAFWKDPLGFVHLRGVMKTGTVGSAAFTLPPGYRPSSTVHLGVISNGAFGRVDIGSDGTVTPVSPSNNASVSLDGIHFKV